MRTLSPLIELDFECLLQDMHYELRWSIILYQLNSHSLEGRGSFGFMTRTIHLDDRTPSCYSTVKLLLINN